MSISPYLIQFVKAHPQVFNQSTLVSQKDQQKSNFPLGRVQSWHVHDGVELQIRQDKFLLRERGGVVKFYKKPIGDVCCRMDVSVQKLYEIAQKSPLVTKQIASQLRFEIQAQDSDFILTTSGVMFLLFCGEVQHIATNVKRATQQEEFVIATTTEQVEVYANCSVLLRFPIRHAIQPKLYSDHKKNFLVYCNRNDIIAVDQTGQQLFKITSSDKVIDAFVMDYTAVYRTKMGLQCATLPFSAATPKVEPEKECVEKNESKKPKTQKILEKLKQVFERSHQVVVKKPKLKKPKVDDITQFLEQQQSEMGSDAYNSLVKSRMSQVRSKRQYVRDNGQEKQESDTDNTEIELAKRIRLIRSKSDTNLCMKTIRSISPTGQKTSIILQKPNRYFTQQYNYAQFKHEIVSKTTFPRNYRLKRECQTTKIGIQYSLDSIQNQYRKITVCNSETVTEQMKAVKLLSAIEKSSKQALPFLNPKSGYSANNSVLVAVNNHFMTAAFAAIHCSVLDNFILCFNNQQFQKDNSQYYYWPDIFDSNKLSAFPVKYAVRQYQQKYLQIITPITQQFCHNHKIDPKQMFVFNYSHLILHCLRLSCQALVKFYNVKQQQYDHTIKKKHLKVQFPLESLLQTPSTQENCVNRRLSDLSSYLLINTAQYLQDEEQWIKSTMQNLILSHVQLLSDSYIKVPLRNIGISTYHQKRISALEKVFQAEESVIQTLIMKPCDGMQTRMLKFDQVNIVVIDDKSLDETQHWVQKKYFKPDDSCSNLASIHCQYIGTIFQYDRQCCLSKEKCADQVNTSLLTSRRALQQNGAGQNKKCVKRLQSHFYFNQQFVVSLSTLSHYVRYYHKRISMDQLYFNYLWMKTFFNISMPLYFLAVTRTYSISMCHLALIQKKMVAYELRLINLEKESDWPQLDLSLAQNKFVHDCVASYKQKLQYLFKRKPKTEAQVRRESQSQPTTAGNPSSSQSPVRQSPVRQSREMSSESRRKPKSPMNLMNRLADLNAPTFKLTLPNREFKGQDIMTALEEESDFCEYDYNDNLDVRKAKKYSAIGQILGEFAQLQAVMERSANAQQLHAQPRISPIKAKRADLDDWEEAGKKGIKATLDALKFVKVNQKQRANDAAITKTELRNVTRREYRAQPVMQKSTTGDGILQKSINKITKKLLKK